MYTVIVTSHKVITNVFFYKLCYENSLKTNENENENENENKNENVNVNVSDYNCHTYITYAVTLPSGNAYFSFIYTLS